jgi:hypothetical protein
MIESELAKLTDLKNHVDQDWRGAHDIWRHIRDALTGVIVVPQSNADMVDGYHASQICAERDVKYYTSIEAALASIGTSTLTTLKISQPCPYSGAMNITANIVLRFTRGGYLQGDAQVMCYSPFLADPNQWIFRNAAGTGPCENIVFANAGILTAAFPQWWGLPPASAPSYYTYSATNPNLIMKYAATACAGRCPLVITAHHDLAFAASAPHYVELPSLSDLHIVGLGSGELHQAVDYGNDAEAGVFWIHPHAADCRNVKIENLALTGPYATGARVTGSPGAGIHAGAQAGGYGDAYVVENLKILKCHIKGFRWSGIMLYGKTGNGVTAYIKKTEIAGNWIENCSTGVFGYKNIIGADVHNNVIEKAWLDGIAFDSLSSGDYQDYPTNSAPGVSESNVDIGICENEINDTGQVIDSNTSWQALAIAIKGQNYNVTVGKNRIYRVGYSQVSAGHTQNNYGIILTQDHDEHFGSGVDISGNVIRDVRHPNIATPGRDAWGYYIQYGWRDITLDGIVQETESGGLYLGAAGNTTVGKLSVKHCGFGRPSTMYSVWIDGIDGTHKASNISLTGLAVSWDGVNPANNLGAVVFWYADKVKAGLCSIDASPVTGWGQGITKGTGTVGSRWHFMTDGSGNPYYSDILLDEAECKVLVLKVAADDTVITTGDDKYHITIPAEFNGMNLTTIGAHVYTASTSGTPIIQVRNVTDSVDMLSTRVVIDENEVDSATAAAAAVIDGAHDDVATADVLAIDVDGVGTGTKGLEIRLGFRLP